ncbi:NUDIX domain-containing protein [Quadrisphaera sp. DSM 44207]|uniref:NUDIX domain-containing protein n=1 Tax=Quadrisphaera sp. DSM 44207 TaxID=1881057 RepID=UPI00088EF715|nr:NUDIX domain-containing protein [Quadrisphaera sp. DSM 44207]SDQ49681.1 8-oxo-dGTP diphosphatase [Quadrisphaera sp. DSM 44207]
MSAAGAGAGGEGPTARTPGRGSVGVQVIILSSRDEVLLQHRDDAPGIAYPNTWAIPGGHLEQAEAPRDCALRELAEELQLFLAPSDLLLLCARQRSYGYEHTFWTRQDLVVEDLVVTEGRGFAWFTHQDTRTLPLGYEDDAVLEHFFAVLQDPSG